MKFFDLFKSSPEDFALKTVRRLADLSEFFPSDPLTTRQLFDVLISLPSTNEPKASWPLYLRNVISLGEPAVESLGSGLGGAPVDQMGKKMYFAIALSYIKSPLVNDPLCGFLELNAGMFIWPGEMGGRIVMFDGFEVIYMAIARAFYWNQAIDMLPRLRAILENDKQNRRLNALPYAIRAIGFIGGEGEIPLIEQFLNYSSPDFDISQATIREEAKRALYALLHPDQREQRANSDASTWQKDPETMDNEVKQSRLPL